jgi:hypothetical protein
MAAAYSVLADAARGIKESPGLAGASGLYKGEWPRGLVSDIAKPTLLTHSRHAAAHPMLDTGRHQITRRLEGRRAIWVSRRSEFGRQITVDFESDADFHECGSCPVH